MTETNKARDLLATLRDALHQLELHLERTRDGVDAIASQAERIRDSVAALGDLRQREDTSVGTEMFVDAAVDLLEALSRTLERDRLHVEQVLKEHQQFLEEHARRMERYEGSTTGGTR